MHKLRSASILPQARRELAARRPSHPKTYSANSKPRCYDFGTFPQLCQALTAAGVMGRPAIAFVGTTDTENGFHPEMKAKIYKRFLEVLRSAEPSTIVTGATDCEVIAIASQACLTANSMRHKARRHKVIGFLPKNEEGLSYARIYGITIAPAVKHVFYLKDAPFWGAEGTFLARSMPYIAAGRSMRAFLAGGGSGTKIEVVAMLAANVELHILKGTGRLADEIASDRLVWSKEIVFEELL